MKSVEKEFLNHKALILLEVEPEDESLRLDEACKKYLKSQSRESIKRMIKKGQITLLNRNTKSCSHTKLRHMDIVRIQRFNEFEVDKLKVLYEDDFLISVLKPKFVPVHPTGIHHFNTVLTILERDLKCKVYPVHRLDIKTSGVMIFAKDKMTATKMQKIFEYKEIQKKYKFKSTKLNSYNSLPSHFCANMAKDEDSSITLKQKIVDIGKISETKFEILSEDICSVSGYAWPITGRTHQIRCHLSYLGLPIIGDDVYSNSDKISRLELHCMEISFLHPYTKSELLIQDKN